MNEWLGQVKVQLEQVSIFNVDSSFNYFLIQNYYQNEPKFNGIYSRNNLPKTKDWAYLIILDQIRSWINQ